MTFFNHFTNININIGNFSFGFNRLFSPLFQSFPFINNFSFGGWNSCYSPFNLPNFTCFSNYSSPSSIFCGMNNLYSVMNMPQYGFDTFNGSIATPNWDISNFNIPPYLGTPYKIQSTISSEKGTGNKSLQIKLVDKAGSYIGSVNSDSEGNRIFSGGKSQAWCADFVTKCVKDTFGSKIPSDFGSSSVSGLRSWGEKNNCYLAVPTEDKSSFIATNIKPGDIMIEKENGKSHTGIVSKVNDDGSFETIEGNCSDSVKSCKYNANSPTLSGFISLEKYA